MKHSITKDLGPWRRAVPAGMLLAAVFAGGGAFMKADDTPTKAVPKPEPDLSWRERLTDLPPGDIPMLPPADFTFNLSWNGVLKAGELRVRFLSSQPSEGTGGERLYAVAKGRSTGPARMLWPYDAEVESWVSAESLSPVRVLQEEADRRATQVYRTDFLGSNVFLHWVTLPKKAGQEKEDRRRVYEEDLIRDLMGSVLYVRSLDFAKKGQTVSFVTFPFRDPYLVDLTYLGEDQHSFLGKQVDALKFEIDIHRIDKKGSLKSYSDRFKSAHIWMTADEQRLPLELRAEIFVGSVRAKITDFRPLGKSAPPLPPIKETVPGT